MQRPRARRRRGADSACSSVIGGLRARAVGFLSGARGRRALLNFTATADAAASAASAASANDEDDNEDDDDDYAPQTQARRRNTLSAASLIVLSSLGFFKNKPLVQEVEEFGPRVEEIQESTAPAP